MSRILLKGKKENRDLVVGLDHAIGWFAQLWDYSKETEEEQLLIDVSALFNGLHKGGLLNLINTHAADSPQKEKVKNCIAMDLDPEPVTSVRSYESFSPTEVI